MFGNQVHGMEKEPQSWGFKKWHWLDPYHHTEGNINKIGCMEKS